MQSQYRQDHRRNCLICGKICSSGKASLTTHLKQDHGLSRKQYFDQYVAGPHDGKCILCGKPASWIERMFVYAKHCSRSCHIAHNHQSNAGYRQRNHDRLVARNTERWKDPEYRERMTGVLRETQAKFHADPRSAEIARQTMKKNWESPEFRKMRSVVSGKTSRKYFSDPKNRDQASLRAVDRLRSKRDRFGSPRGLFVQERTGTKMFSLHEVDFADRCDELGIKWVYEPETVVLPDGTRYTPDFALPDLNRLVEIKGKNLRLEELCRGVLEMRSINLDVVGPRKFHEFLLGVTHEPEAICKAR